jgi:hypothetical protein
MLGSPGNGVDNACRFRPTREKGTRSSGRLHRERCRPRLMDRLARSPDAAATVWL